jgi:AcrR family transcriptional regulator
MGVYTHFGSKQGLLEQLYLYGFRRLEDRLNSVSLRWSRPGRSCWRSPVAYRAFALDNEALYGLMFERATPDFVPSDASRLAGLATFEMLATRVADWRPDLTDPAADAHLIWATMHGLVTIELMHTRWGGPLVAHLQGDPEQTTQRPSARSEALHGRQARPPPRAVRVRVSATTHTGSRTLQSLGWHSVRRPLRAVAGMLRQQRHSAAQRRPIGDEADVVPLHCRAATPGEAGRRSGVSSAVAKLLPVAPWPALDVSSASEAASRSA